MQKVNQEKIGIFFLVMIFSFFLASENSLAQVTSPVSGEGDLQKIEFKNPLTHDSLEGLMISAMTVIQGVVAVLAVFMIVVAGLIYITSAGSNRTETAKNIASGAVIGLVIALSAPSLLKEVFGVLGYPTSSTGSDEAVTAIESSKSLYELVLAFTSAILNFIGALSILMIIVAGVVLIVSGDSKNSEMAKKTITWAVGGLVVALTSLILVNAIVGVFQ